MTERNSGRHRLTHGVLVIAAGAATWLVYGPIAQITMRYLWETDPPRPYSELFMVELCAIAALVVVVASVATSWLRIGHWWQQWPLFVGGLTLGIFVRSYWSGGGLELALGVLSRAVFITCVIASLVAFVSVFLFRTRLRPNNALERTREG